jgi:hypothetical protein
MAAPSARPASQRLARVVIGLLVGVIAGFFVLAAVVALLYAISTPR